MCRTRKLEKGGRWERQMEGFQLDQGAELPVPDEAGQVKGTTLPAQGWHKEFPQAHPSQAGWHPSHPTSQGPAGSTGSALAVLVRATAPPQASLARGSLAQPLQGKPARLGWGLFGFPGSLGQTCSMLILAAQPCKSRQTIAKQSQAHSLLSGLETDPPELQ